MLVIKSDHVEAIKVIETIFLVFVVSSVTLVFLRGVMSTRSKGESKGMIDIIGTLLTKTT